MHRSRMLIDGQSVHSLSGQTAIIRNPANQDPVGEVSVGDSRDARLALEAAQRALPVWKESSAEMRGRLLHSGAENVRQRADEIARLLTLEVGKPLKDSRREVEAAARVLDYYAEEGRRVFGQWIQSERGRSLVVKEPIGVAVAITPWNYPVDLTSWKVGPALAAGCTMVVKPPSKAPLAATAFSLAVHEGGLPPGVLNVVHGPGSDVGAELVENPISRKISLTGETETGRWIMEHAASRIKRISLELGGSAPFIVCPDADIESAALSCARRAFANAGQLCISVNRIYVAEEVADRFIPLLVAGARALRVGDGQKPGVDMGPLFSQDQLDRTKEHIADAVLKGAEILCGGRPPEGEEYELGYFFLPTVLDHVDHSMRVMQEETFGPVAPIMRVASIDEAISFANDSRYGLAAYIYTQDLLFGLRAAERLEAGSVSVNNVSPVDLHAPFGGWKESGLGRELSSRGIDEYLEVKHIRLGL